MEKYAYNAMMHTEEGAGNTLQPSVLLESSFKKGLTCGKFNNSINKINYTDKNSTLTGSSIINTPLGIVSICC